MTKNKNHIKALIEALEKMNQDRNLKKIELLKVKYAIH